MVDSQLVLYDEDYRKVLAVCERLARDSHAKGVFVVDKNGQLLAEAGDIRGIDTTSLASLTAGSVAATGGLAKIIGEEEFPIHFHQGQQDNLHMTLVARRIILVIIFDERSSLGLVRLRVKKGQRRAGPALRGDPEEERAGAQRRGESLLRDHRRRYRPPLFGLSPHHVVHQLRVARDQLQGRVLRPGALREDDQPAVHLREDQSRAQGQDDFARDRNRAHPLFRLPAPGPRADPRLQDALSTSTPFPARCSTTRAASSS